MTVRDKLEQWLMDSNFDHLNETGAEILKAYLMSRPPPLSRTLGSDNTEEVIDSLGKTNENLMKDNRLLNTKIRDCKHEFDLDKRSMSDLRLEITRLIEVIETKNKQISNLSDEIARLNDALINENFRR